MNDDDNAADQPTMAADNDDATAAAPPSTRTGPRLAWSLDDGDDEHPPDDRQPWLLAWAQAAVFVLIGGAVAFAVGVVGWVLVRAHDDRQQAPPVAHRTVEVRPATGMTAPSEVVGPSTVTVEATPTTVTVKPTPSAITVRATAPTVTVEAAPTTVTSLAPVSTVPPPRRSSVSAPREIDSIYDQRFLDHMRSLGYVIFNPELMLRNAHEACRLFQQGESADQVNQDMSARMRTNMTDTLQLTSSAMLAYPDCY